MCRSSIRQVYRRLIYPVNSVTVNDSSGGAAISLYAAKPGKGMAILDKEGKEKFWVTITPSRNELQLWGKSPYQNGIVFYGDSNEAKQTTWRP